MSSAVYRSAGITLFFTLVLSLVHSSHWGHIIYHAELPSSVSVVNQAIKVSMSWCRFLWIGFGFQKLLIDIQKKNKHFCLAAYRLGSTESAPQELWAYYLWMKIRSDNLELRFIHFKYLGLKNWQPWKLPICNLKTEKRIFLPCCFLCLLYTGLRFWINLRKFYILLPLSIIRTTFSHNSNCLTLAAWLRHSGRDAAAFPLETAYPVWHNW